MPAFGRRVKLAVTLLETMYEAELQEEYHLRKEALLRTMEADRVVALAAEVSGGPTRKPQNMWGGSSENARTRRRRTRAAERASVQAAKDSAAEAKARAEKEAAAGVAAGV
jgi:hypothetical protein